MIRVIKLGGSLLTLPDWHERLLRWLATDMRAINVLLIGGGELVDVLRREHERFPYTERHMHFAALAAMDINAKWALARLPNAKLVQSIAELQHLHAQDVDRKKMEESSIFLVHITSWWNAAAVDGQSLPPETWETTSDTLAAWIAGLVNANELVLLKSATPPEQTGEWSEQGYVDANFFQAIRKSICYRAVNLLNFKYDEVGSC